MKAFRSVRALAAVTLTLATSVTLTTAAQASSSPRKNPLPLILMYHDIVDRDYFDEARCNEAVKAGNPQLQELYCQPDTDVTLANFVEQMKYLKDAGYVALSMDEFFQARLEDRPLPPRSVVLTFDDAYTGNYELARPILKLFGLKASFFVHTDYVGVMRLRPGQVLPPGTKTSAKDHVTWEQFREMERDLGEDGQPLFKLYSHTKTHPHLPLLAGTPRLQEELCESKAAVEREMGGSPRDYFAYPYGEYSVKPSATNPQPSYDPRVLEMARQCGYKMAVVIDTYPGTPVDEIFGMFVVPRMYAGIRQRTLGDFKATIRKFYEDYSTN